MSLPPDIKFQKKLVHWSMSLAFLVLLIAVAVLVGWGFNIEWLKRPGSRLAAMNPTTALAFIFSAISFLLLAPENRSKQGTVYGKAFACLALLIGSLRILGLITNSGWQADQVLFSEKLKSDGTGSVSSEMASNTACCFILTGISLLVLNFETTRKRVPVHYISLAIFLMGLLSLLGHIYRVQAFPMAIYTALCFLFLSLAILFANPGKGLMKEFTSIYTGSIVGRTLIPIVIIVPSVLGLLRLYGYWYGLFTTEFGVTILVLSIIVVFLGISWHNTVLLNKREALKNEIATALQESEKQVQTIFDSAPDAVILIDEEGKIVKWNPKAETLFGWNKNEITGMPLSEVIIPHRYREAHKKGLKHFLQTGEGPVLNRSIEVHALNKNNVEFDISLSISPTIVSGKYLFIGFIRDITDHKRAEEQVRKQKQEIQDFIDSMSTLSAKLSTDGKILMLNKIALQASGLSLEELHKTDFIEGQWWTFDPEVHARVREAFKKACSGTAINYDENIFAFGQVLTINFSLIPILNAAKNVDYIVAEGRDITAQKKAEENLRQLNMELEKRVDEKTKEIIQSERKFRKLIENSTDIIALTDENFKPVYRSPSSQRITGWSDEEREKFDSIEQTHPDDLERTKTIMNKILANPGKPFHVSMRTRHRDGHYIWVEGMITNMLHDKSIKAIVSNLRDVTENKQAEQALRESQQLLSAIINNSAAVIYVKSLQGRYIMVNRRFSELFHVSAEDIIGKTDHDFLSKEVADTVRQMDIRAATSDHAITEEEIVPLDDGLHTYISVKSTLRDNTGQPYATFGISTDITEIKKAEEAILHAEANYREIFEKASDAIYVHEKETGRILEVNQRSCEITGYTKEELINGNPQDFITDNPQYSLQHAMNYIQKAAAGTPQLFEWLGKNKDGSSNWLEVNLKSATIAGKERILAFFREINERKQAEENIKLLNENLEIKVKYRTAQLEDANRELEAFSYSVSHDLRAPLRIIDGYTEILVTDYHDKLDDEGKRLFGIIAANARKMGQLIDDLLNLSQTGRKELVRRPADMNKLVQPVIEEQLSITGNKSHIKMNDLLPAECDSGLLRQVWSNLIGNAIKYSSKKKQPVIEISSSANGNEIVYAIQDNGVGFDMQYADKLFGVFQRLHHMTEFEGTGVGLALVKRIVTRHGGRIWAEAEPGKGATFFFSLPARQTTSPV